MNHQLVSYHLQKTSELKKLANEQLERGFFANTIAEKLGWTQPVISADLNDIKNGISAENYKPNPLRFADVWSFTECDKRFGHDFKGRIPGSPYLAEASQSWSSGVRILVFASIGLLDRLKCLTCDF